MTKSILLLSCAAGALSLSLGAGGAFAADAAAAAAESSQSTTTVTDIVVVAEERVQNLQAVPVALTALTAKQRELEGIVSLEEITAYAPGLTYQSSLDHLFVRGVGRQTTDLAAPSGVATFFDGFYSPDPVLAVLPPMFVQDTEVFRGPQGTLGGRNGIGGSLVVTSKRPTDTPYAEARVTYGSYGFADVEVAASDQLLPGLDGRIGGTYTTQPQGYFKNVAGGPSEGAVINEYHLEGSITAQFGDHIDLFVRAYANDWDNGAGGPGSRVGTTSTPYSTFLNDDSDAYNFNPSAGYNSAAVIYPGGPPLILPGSLNQLNPSITGNPSVSNIRNFSGFGGSKINLTNAYGISGILTFHAPGFDVRYTTGYSQYAYRTRDDFAQEETDVVSYTVNNVNNPGCAATLNPLAQCLQVFPNDRIDYTQNDAWYSHEVTLVSTDNSPLQWVGGLYYYHEDFSNPIYIVNAGQAQVAAPCYFAAYSPGTAPSAACPSNFGLSVAPANPGRDLAYLNYVMSANSYAAYGQIDWKISSQFKLTGGLRYTYDDEGGTEYLRAVAFGGSGLAGFLQGAVAGGAPPQLLYLAEPQFIGNATPAIDETTALCGLDNSVLNVKGRTSLCTVNAAGDAQRNLEGSSSGLTGTAGAEWTPDDSTLAYIRYSRGYKSVGFNAGYDMVGVPTSEVAPEFMNDYEIGLKKSFGRTLSFNATLFYEDYINAQVPLGVLTLTGVHDLLTSIPKSRSDGFELEANWAPIDHLHLSLSYAFDDTAVLSGCTLVPTPTNCFIDSANPKPGAVSVKGDELPNAPKNKVSVNAYYTFVFDPGSLTVSASYLWRDRQFGSVFNAPWWVAPSSSDVDLRATWQGPNDRYEIVGYVKNVFNSLQYEAGPAAGTAGDAFNAGTYTRDIGQSIDPPRTFGVEVHYKFF